MLTLALAATLIGFVLLILGLITGTVWLAVACIVICLLGLSFLLVDVFSGRNRDSARSLEDMVPGAGRDDDTDDVVDREDTGFGGERRDAGDESPTRRNPPATPPARDTDSDAETAAYEAPSFEPGMGAPPRPSTDRPPAPENRPAPERREGNLEDYLRSVGEPVGRGPQQPGGQPPRPMPPRTPQPGPRSPQYGTPPPGPQQQFGQNPTGQQSAGQRPEWGQDQEPPRADPAQSGERPRGEAPETPEPRPGRRRAPDFDPLDPNWRPPLD